MEFKEFANRMDSIIGTNKNISAFIRTLFEAILPSDKYEELLANTSSNNLKSYYYGNNRITRLAKKIYAFANPRLFEIFILGLDKNQKLAHAFSDAIPGITPDNAAELIADFFYLIIYEAIKPNIQTIFTGGGYKRMVDSERNF